MPSADIKSFLAHQGLSLNVDEETELSHHGIKGMRWGVRRTDAQLNKGKATEGGSEKKKAKAADSKGRFPNVKLKNSNGKLEKVSKEELDEAKAKRKESKEPEKKQAPEPPAEAVRKADLLNKPTSKMTNDDVKFLTERLRIEDELSKYRHTPNAWEKLVARQKKVETVLSVAKTVGDVVSFGNTPQGKAIRGIFGVKTPGQVEKVLDKVDDVKKKVDTLKDPATVAKKAGEKVAEKAKQAAPNADFEKALEEIFK